jgi:hypothetical protein
MHEGMLQSPLYRLESRVMEYVCVLGCLLDNPIFGLHG